MGLMDVLGDSAKIRSPFECAVTVDGKGIEDLYPSLLKVVVEMKRGRPDVCSLTFESVRDERGSWSIQDSRVFAPWKKIRVEAVFGNRREEVIRGYVREVNAEYPEDLGTATVTVAASDESLLLEREHLRRKWSTEESPMSDGSIAKVIAGDHGLSAEVEDGLQSPRLNQDDTPLRFLQQRARTNGHELFIREETLHFIPPRLEGEPQAPIMVDAGHATNCLSFSVTHDGYKPDKVRVVRAGDSGTGVEEETASSDLALLGSIPATSEGMGLSPFVWHLHRASGGTLNEAKALAQARANENAWKVVAQGELDGFLYGHVLLTYETVLVEGIGDTYGGVYYVDAVTHSFTQEGYRQKFHLLRNAIGGRGGSAGQGLLGGLL